MPIDYAEASAMWNAYSNSRNLWREATQRQVRDVMQYNSVTMQHERFEENSLTSRCPYCRTQRPNNTFCENEFCIDHNHGISERTIWR